MTCFEYSFRNLSVCLIVISFAFLINGTSKCCFECVCVSVLWSCVVRLLTQMIYKCCFNALKAKRIKLVFQMRPKTQTLGYTYICIRVCEHMRVSFRWMHMCSSSMHSGWGLSRVRVRARDILGVCAALLNYCNWSFWSKTAPMHKLFKPRGQGDAFG